MDFLGVGVPELIVIIILALIFIGPRDLPRMAGRFAKFLRDLRMMSEGFTTEWRREIAAASRIEGLKELKEELEATRDTLREAGQEIKGGMRITEADLEPETADQTDRQTEQPTAAAEPEQTIHPPGTVPAGTNHRAPAETDAPEQDPAVETTAENGAPSPATETPPATDETADETATDHSTDHPDETPSVAASPTEPAADKEEIPNRG